MSELLTTPPPEQLLYSFTSTYHWPQFNKNATRNNFIGNWKSLTGLGQGPFGFGKAIKFENDQVG